MEIDIKNKKALAVIIFFATIVFIIIYNLCAKGSLYSVSADGNLYISVAENFLKTGHFIQNVRSNEINMVVPPGLPFIIMISEIIFGNINGVLFIQYILFGFTCAILLNIILNIYDSKILSILSVVIYILSTAVLKDTASPSYILTEIYTLFLITVLLYVLTIKNKNFDEKLKICLPILTIGFFIRTVFGVWLILFYILSFIRIIQKKLPIKSLLKVFVITMIILSINILINYRETGEFVMIQNYGGIPIYQANNPNTKTTPYSSTYSNDFVEQDFIKIYSDNEKTTGEKSQILNKKAKKWIINNPATFLKNTFKKFYLMFIKAYNLDFYIFIFTLLFVIIKYKKYEYALYLLMFGLMAGTTSMGLNIARYSYFALIFYIIAKMVFIKGLYGIIFTKRKA